MTVSRALRNQPNVKPEVREKILKIAAQIGYRPNPLISTLMASLKKQHSRRNSEVIAFITADPEGRDQWRASPTVTLFYEGAVARAEQLGYRLEHFWAKNRGMTPSRLAKVLYSRSISGLLLAPSWRAQHHEYPDFDWTKFAPATLGYTLAKPELHRACNNQYLTMRHALQHLRARGYSRIGLAISRSDDDRVLNHWQAAYLADQALHGPHVKPVPVFLSDEIMENPVNREPFQRWARTCKPDVVISVHHNFLMDWLREIGMDVPGDVGYADLDLSDNMIGEIAGMDQNSRFVGSAAIDLIAGQHHRNERGVPAVPTITSVSGEWRDGRTVRELRPLRSGKQPAAKTASR